MPTHTCPATSAPPRPRRRRDDPPAPPRPTVLYRPRHALHDGARIGAQAQPSLPAYRAGAMAGGGAHMDGLPWLLRTACTDAAGWNGGQVCVSLGRADLVGDVLLEQVGEALEASGLAPDRLILAIAEATLAQPGTDTAFALAALRDLGVGLEVEDFGSDCGSMMLLKRLPLTALKLSRALLRDIATSAEDAAILQAIVIAAGALAMDVVADGIDSRLQAELLALAGCDQGQGSLFG